MVIGSVFWRAAHVTKKMRVLLMMLSWIWTIISYGLNWHVLPTFTPKFLPSFAADNGGPCFIYLIFRIKMPVPVQAKSEMGLLAG